MSVIVRRLFALEAFKQENRPPAWFWLIPAVVVLLRSLPILWLQVIPPPAGSSYAGVSFIPKDFLAYLAFIRQTTDDGSFIYCNPFTTDPQTPRFILLFHWIVGVFSRVTGLSPNAAFEFSRVPLTFLFFAVLWAFLLPILSARRDRIWACVLVGFSGGFDALHRACAGLLPKLPPFVSEAWEQGTDSLLGWSTFASFFNPMWTAALVAALLVLGPLLSPVPARVASSWRVALGVFLLYWIHPYTAIGVVAIAVMLPILEWAATHVNLNRIIVLGAGLLPPILLIALIGRWQSSDLVYRVSSNNVFGPQAAAVFWYPLTFGALGFMALRGAKEWGVEAHPWRLPFLAWVIAIALLHSSPLLNGYKFVFLLHLPLCVVAARPVRKIFEGARGNAISRWRALALGLCLFISTPLLTLESLRDVERDNLVERDYTLMVRTMARLPRGNAFVPPRLGNLLPAFTPHRVWVGQWFLTPQNAERREWFDRFTTDPQHFAEFQQLLAAQRINYIVVPAERADWLAQRLGQAVRERIAGGVLTLLVLR